MTSHVINGQVEKYVRKMPDITPGNTVRVHERILEGEKERTQVFEGLVIGMHNGHLPTDRSFTIRKVVSGIGVEKVFPLHSPMLQKVLVTKKAKVRRAKLNFLRGRRGRAAKMTERFTKNEEFTQAVSAVAETKKESSDSPDAEKKVTNE
ncbi:50S ribosomal protein L19 [Candidatus Peregrinibacteria bacterium]|nr:50S ribosomal protein L19 [Candidatus Peregrinibacteria bacterium]